MRKLFFILTLSVPALPLFAQEPADALRFSWVTPGGTARQQAIGGAMTSVGGDLSAMFVNPAGLGFYRTGDFVITPGFSFLNNKSTYYGHTEKKSKNAATFGTTGVVLGTETRSRRNKKRSSVAVAFGLNRSGSFGSSVLYRGLNTQSSYSQKFLEEIKGDKDGNSVASNYPFGASLAFNTYWIDTIAGGSTGNYQFQSRAPVATGLLQESSVINRGGITEFALAGAIDYNEKLFIGGTIGVPV
ncbi:MAG TPA: aromatic hydrocarbon degradation protein, partial [Chitinophagaceae bacterium]|nr:aromatic hydrocarbon degradation protein [Chitinophagaceae bacterium]